MKFKTLLAITPVILAGCASTTFTKTGDSEASPLAEGCPINIYTTTPRKPFVELGVIDIDYKCVFACPDNDTAGGAKKLIAKDVCSAGGNGVLLWEANGFGFYTKATVIKTQK